MPPIEVPPKAGDLFLTVVTPAFNEARNLPELYQELCRVLGALPIRWEWVVVDDHSDDGTLATVAEICRQDARVRGVRLARNFGAHTAITCGLFQARGDCAVILAADMQDPPAVIPELLAKRQEGAQVVWATRERREGEKASTIGFSRTYYAIMRHIVGMKDIPSMGADFFLLDRRVMDAFRDFNESNVSILALITWMGFRQAAVSYTKEARLHGRSGWTLEKKLKLALDSITSFTYLPIRLMSYFGFLTAVVGFVYAIFVIANAMTGNPPQGWSSLMVVVLLVGGLQMLMLGILGEYLWRALDESRRRPRFLIEETVERSAASGQSGNG